ncbi:tail fiber assembly protein [Paraburkholderia tropica]|uniref:tail fiber assembly protein n=1 Tax=Paraburkholderia tropica TaxID=92647 RepID=UPI002AB6DCB6|nr:tail fiber assembly protein [Paraburkholderia tropica]
MEIDIAGYTHDLMALTVKDMYPGLVHGVDFVVAHMIDEETGAQKGDPFILAWKSKAHAQPTDDEVHARFRANEAALRAAYIRSLRNEALSNTDHRTTSPPDAPATLTKNVDGWRTYRQALRDVTQQEGFPFNVVWPERPDTSGD